MIKELILLASSAVAGLLLFNAVGRSEQECRQRYNVATGEVHYSCQQKITRIKYDNYQECTRQHPGSTALCDGQGIYYFTKEEWDKGVQEREAWIENHPAHVTEQTEENIYALFVCSYFVNGTPSYCKFLDGPYRSVEDCRSRQKMYPANIGDDHVGHTVFRCMGKPGWAAVN